MPHFQVQRLGANSQFRCSHSPNMRFFHRSSLKYRQPMTVEVPFPEHATQKHDAHFRQIQFYKSKETCKYWYKYKLHNPFHSLSENEILPTRSSPIGGWAAALGAKAGKPSNSQFFDRCYEWVIWQYQYHGSHEQNTLVDWLLKGVILGWLSLFSMAKMEIFHEDISWE